ncbi:sulfotransferase family protein, partial [Vibrio pomeroyi]
MNNRKVIVVLGMHRSGTSAITKSLELFGVNLGEKLYGASFDNPKGFWEDEECLRINQELLSINGYEYNSIIKAPDLENEKVKSLFLEAVSIVARNVERYKLWAFKDPRTCRLLEFWQSVFEKVGCEVNYIFVSRNPISVAKSLNKRNHLDLESSYFLWAQHVYMAVSTMKHRCLFLDYDDFMDNNKNNISKISNFLNVVPNNDKVSEYSTEFLSNKLRHTKFSELDVINNSSIPNFVKSIFLPLDKVAKSGMQDYEVNKELLLNKSSADDFNYACR